MASTTTGSALAVAATVVCALLISHVHADEHLLKPTQVSMSSTYDERFPASSCIDGSVFPGKFCHSRNNDADPYIQLDFGEEVVVSKIVITNRKAPTICGARARCGNLACTLDNIDSCCPDTELGKTCGLDIRVGNTACHTELDACTSNAKCAVTIGPDSLFEAPAMQGEIKCGQKLTGRYVQVRHPGPTRFINLNEVQVFGIEKPTVTTTTRTTTTDTMTTATDTFDRLADDRLSVIEKAIFAELDDEKSKIDVLQEQVAQLQRDLERTQTDLAKANKTIAANQDLGATLRDAVTDLTSNLDQVDTVLESLITKLSKTTTKGSSIAPVCSNAPGSDTQFVTADGDNLNIASCNGKVVLASQECTVNPCELKQQLDDIASALSQA